MGLGLFLARSVTERLGGELLLESESGRGTTVRLRLPLEP
jgi:signal transduction histidine kinase